MVATTAAAPAMSHFIVIIPATGLMLSPPESNVIPLPTSPTEGRLRAAAVAGV